MDRVIRNPATGQVIESQKEHSVADVSAAVSAARRAQATWAALPVRDRARRIRQLERFVVNRAESIAQTIRDCTGKTLTDAWSTELLPLAIMIRYYSRKAHRFLRVRRLPPSSPIFLNKRIRLQREPFGVVGIISPWNYPVGIPMHEVLAALLAGNGVLLKVATQAQPAGEQIAEMLSSIDLPDGLFTLLHLPGPVAGDALLDAGVDRLCFTGSTRVGRELAEKAGARLIPIGLELGGNDAMIVLSDAPLDRAVSGAIWAGLSNAGQSCSAVERIYVVDDVYDEFARLLRSRIGKLRSGFDETGNIDLGSLTTGGQMEVVVRHLADADRRGAVRTAASDSGPESGLFHPAVLVEGVDEDAELLRDETFGPVLALQRVKDVEEAVEHANRSIHGLSASVWTRNRATGRAVARRLEVGTVTVNDHLMSHGIPSAPWGGYKQSGIGRAHGEIGMQAMTQVKVVVEELLPGMRKNLWWQPNSPEVLAALKGLLVVLVGRGFFLRVRWTLRGLRLALKRAFRQE